MDTTTIQWLMNKVIKHLENELISLQIGRASTGLVDNIDIYIPAYDMKQKLSQLANVVVMDAQTIKIEPWDKSTISSIEKGIYDSNIGLTPQNMWDYVMIKVPALTQERRQNLIKLVAQYGEDNKIALRNIRHDILKDIKKQFDEKLISEDQKKLFEKECDEITKQYTTKIDQLVKIKSEEIMKI